MSDRVLLIGLDAACFEQLDPLLADGVVPTLSGLIEEGAAAGMETTTPPWTPSAWPSITTGTTPWTHGVYDFHHHAGDGSVEYVSARHVQVPFLWEVLSAAGHESVAVNVPVTHPAHRFSGSLVPGYVAPEDATCLIEGSPGSIDEVQPDYRIYTHSGGSREARIADYEELIASRAAVASTLAERGNPSFLMVQFQSTDGVFHMFGEDREAIDRVFGSVDDAVAKLIDDVAPDWTLVVSDHGIHRYERVFHANTWLRNRGHVETSPGAERWSWNARTVANRKGKTGGESGFRLLPRLLGALSQVGITPQRGEALLSAIGLDELVARALPENALLDVVDAAEHVDWDVSAAFCRSSASMGLRCNVAGRDPGGVVPREEFPSFRAELVEALRGVEAPDGTPVFERVYDRHRVHGPEVANERSAPDVVFRPADMVWRISDVIRERPFGRTREYDHKYEGLFVAHGPGIDPGVAGTPEATDVAPTVLELLGVATPSWMEGSPIGATVASGSTIDTPPAVPEREYVDDARADEAVEDRLRELGYVD